jgi:HlyD family secretion protein
MKALTRTIVPILVLVLGAGGGVGWYLQSRDGQTTSFRTAQVTRGDLAVTISATGTLEPEEVVDVGAQVAGQILAFGTDAAGTVVDYGSVVEQGKMLARIDDALYQAEVAQAESQVRLAQAGVQRAQADLAQLKAKLSQAERDWGRAQKLGPSEALAQVSYDAYKSAHEVAAANVDIGEAALVEAQATLAQAETSLWRAKRNLGYCTITSPVSGVIIDRRVNIGQTVVASLNAPSLFLIAKDLKRMQIWAAVNEADVGKVRPGQPVTFTVDAFPGETFGGEVGKVRLNASMTQNVVTYTVEITADNSDGRLLPYLTANVRFEVERSKNVMLAPNAALHWQPTADQVAPEYTENAAATTQPQGEKVGVLWAVQGEQVRPVHVRVGLTDGIKTEVEGQGLTDGMEIVTGVQSGTATQSSTSSQSSASSQSSTPAQSDTSAQSDTRNPFLPKMPTPPKGGPGGGPPPL